MTAAMDTATPGPVVHDDRLAQALGQLLPELAGHDVGRPARHEPNDRPYRLGGEGLRNRNGRRRASGENQDKSD
jgi:hypothetical protein